MEEEIVKEKSALLVGVNIFDTEVRFNNSMLELEDLGISSGIEKFYKITQNRDRIDARLFIGKGKVEEMAEMIALYDIDLVVFNDELSGSQLNNIMEILQVKVIDRPTLILDIFAKRANTRLAKLQIELAQLQYRLPRLKGLGNSMSRLGAGIGTRGPGEQKLELDRRIINEKITDIKRQLKKMENVRDVQRKQRVESNLPIVSLVGYSNVGKSTLFNKLMNMSNPDLEDVYVDDMLFATLGTFTRLITLENKKEFILNDTVGFVSKLPHFLIEAFKATLEEINTSDLILHVVDIEAVDTDIEIAITNNILEELGCTGIPKIMLYNKIDIKGYPIETGKDDELRISALNDINLDGLLDKVESIIFSNKQVKLLFPFNRSDYASYIFDKYQVNDKKYVGEGVIIDVDLDEIDSNKFKEFIFIETDE